MTKEKNSRQGNDSFWRIVSENSKEVQEWPEWKRSINITSATASTGKFIHFKSIQKDEKLTDGHKS